MFGERGWPLPSATRTALFAGDCEQRPPEDFLKSGLVRMGHFLGSIMADSHRSFHFLKFRFVCNSDFRGLTRRKGSKLINKPAYSSLAFTASQRSIGSNRFSKSEFSIQKDLFLKHAS